ncbi:MAG: hypothetical protein U0586_08960 [Candidatus Brocadiaceae bacterium]
MKNIIVVADEDLKKLGRELVHSISKTKAAKASLYTPKQYTDNEHQITGAQYVIFLGKNKVSEDFIPLIPKKYENHGVVWGYDDTKAIIYIETNDTDLNNLTCSYKYLKENWYHYLNPFYGMIKDFKKMKKDPLQLKIGVISFLKDGFGEFIKE